MSTSVSTCKGCGAQIIFPYGQDIVKCEYCGSVNARPETADKGEVDAESLIRRAYILLEDGNFEQARLNLEMSLNLEPESAAAYIGLLMVDVRVRTESGLINSLYPLTGSRSYANALRFATPEQKAMLENYAHQVEERMVKKGKQTIRTVVIVAGAVGAFVIILVAISFYNIMAFSIKSQALAQQEEATSRVFDTETSSSPSPLPSQVNAAISGGSFSFTSDDVFAHLQSVNSQGPLQFERRHTIVYPDYTADWAHTGGIMLLCYTNPVDKSVNAISLVLEESYLDAASGDYFFFYLMKILEYCNVSKTESELNSELGLSTFTNGSEPTSISSDDVNIDFAWNDGSLYFKIYPQSDILNAATLPIVLEPSADFLYNETRREAFSKLKVSYDYPAILEMANEYVSQNNPNKTDNVYAVIEQAQSAADAMGNCSVERDEFDGSTSIYYNGVENLSSEINLLPYIQDGKFILLVGFTDSSWLNCTKAEIKIGENDFIYISFSEDAVRKEIGNGIIEYAELELYNDDFDKIVNAESPILRFTGEDDQTREHTITESEQYALKAIYTIDSANETLFDLWLKW